LRPKPFGQRVAGKGGGKNVNLVDTGNVTSLSEAILLLARFKFLEGQIQTIGMYKVTRSWVAIAISTPPKQGRVLTGTGPGKSRRGAK
jgi:hypothetical protein